MEITIQNAVENDLDWINTQYQSISFLLSDLKDEKVILAKVDGINAGIGRIKNINELIDVPAFDSNNRSKYE